LTPTQMILLCAAAIFICEVGVMHVLNVIPRLSHEIEALIDSTILLTFLTPVYFFLYRPFWRAYLRHENQVRYLSQRLISASEEERKRMSQDLHDHFGQMLTGLQFSMQTLKKSLPENTNQQKSQIDDIVRIISQLGNELRDVSYRLRPTMLDEMGLISALRSLISEFRAIKKEVEIVESFVYDEQTVRMLDQEIEVAVYRICQEALNNIVKYSCATEVILNFEQQTDRIFLSIIDNGIGLDPDRVFNGKRGPDHGIGVLGMRERVEALDGTFFLYSTLGEGVEIDIDLPVKLRDKK